MGEGWGEAGAEGGHRTPPGPLHSLSSDDNNALLPLLLNPPRLLPPPPSCAADALELRGEGRRAGGRRGRREEGAAAQDPLQN
eukprot:3932879-Rhodomonas_salina.2